MRIGRDLAALGAECGVTLDVRESAGSVENMKAVRDRRATQLGIVQSDVLEYFQHLRRRRRGAAAGRRTGSASRFRSTTRRCTCWRGASIGGLADLAGQRVATGAEGSGTRITADLILDLAQVAPAERLALAPEAALEALLAGEIDALFYVVGAPAELFRSDADRSGGVSPAADDRPGAGGGL